MGFDDYRVEVLHYINPHLIWTLVQKSGDENDFCFEQIGIYGILPQNITFGVDCVIKTERCEEWMPAAAIAMKRCFLNSAEVRFSPTYVDKKSSLFDNNTHKFGDLIIIKKDGQKLNVREEILNSEFAFEDESLFHRALSDNNLKTNINCITTHDVISKISEGYKTRGIPQKVWLTVLKSQTSVHEEAKQLESSAASRKLEVHDRKNLDMLLKKKLNALKLCKDIDEVSVGRACSSRETVSTSSSVVNVAMKKKLDWLKSQSIENRSFVLNQPTETIANVEVKPSDAIEDKPDNDGSIKRGKKFPRDQDTKYVAIGPAGLSANKFIPKPLTAEGLNKPKIEKTKEPQPEKEIEVQKDQDVYANTDSEVNLEISNLNIMKKVKSGLSDLNRDDPVRSDYKMKGETLSAIKRKINYLEEKLSRVHDSSISSVSDSSKCDLELNAESVSALVEKIDSRYTNKQKQVNAEPENFDVQVNFTNVNPYKNFDGSISIFVDKLVSPVLMVHTKKNNRIIPSSEMRDIPFGKDIHNALRNMSISKPMRPQTISWPTILRGHSFFLIGPSKSGATMGYLPAVCKLVSDFKMTPDRFGLSCIIVCATSHSVSIVKENCRMFLHSAKILACYAGMSDVKITTTLLNGVDLVICTPCMLIRLLQDDFGLDIRNLSTFVIDDCEHISKIYPTELVFCLLKIMELMKNRAHKEWKVQFIIISRIWCDFMSSLARKAADSVICISAFEECVLYSKAATSFEFVSHDDKLTKVHTFLEGIDKSKKTVIVCRTDDEVKFLEKSLTKLKYVVFSCDSSMTVQDLYNLDKILKEYQEPVSGPILVCCDGNLTHLNVTDGYYLIHYSLPDLYSTFCKRFAVLIDNYASIFKDEVTSIKIKILLDDNNIEQLPRIHHFIKRCTQEVSPVLEDICTTILSEKQLKKAQNFVPLCQMLMTLGKCPDYWNCIERHSIFKQYDSPKPWMPTEGVINFQLLHYHSAVNYSARLLSCVTHNNTVKYAQTYSLLSLKMGMYYSKAENLKLHSLPNVGDVCALSLKRNLFVRCQVAKILTSTKNQPNHLLVKLIDEERYEIAHDTALYYLPDDLKDIETHVVRVILANLIPQDQDVTFSKLAENKLKKITDEGDLYMRGRITMVVGNIIFVGTLEACQDLCSLEEVVVKCDFRKELLDGHAIPNPAHIDNLKKISDFTFDTPKEQEQRIELPVPVKVLPKGQWAHLENDTFSSIYFMYAVNPSKFFVRLSKFDKCLTTLIKDIKTYVTENTKPADTVNVGDIVLAEFPDDAIFERAKIDSDINNNKVKCFFVDQGEWRDVHINKVLPITDKLITQLPYQAIECRLVGVQPLSNDWTDFSTNFFVDSCFDSLDKHKQLFAKYFTSEIAEFTDGHKYGVVLIDTYSTEDVIINRLMVDKNLAEENEEIELLNNLGFRRQSEESSDSDMDDKPIQAVTNKEKEIVPYENNQVSLSPNKKLLWSGPLGGSDESFGDFELVTNEEGKFGGLSLKELSEEWSEIILVRPTEDSKVSPKSTQDVEKISKPKLLWRQDTKTVTIKIEIIVDTYDITIKERSIKFSAENTTKYGFDFELYGVVDLPKSSHANKGQNVLVKLSKVMAGNWKSLTRDGAEKKWIVYDYESIEVSSDEESDIYDHRKALLENFADSDSDDNFQDDVS